MTGCSTQNKLVLEQPSAPPAQRQISLASKWAFSRVENGRRHVLLAFPLPGAVNGARDFLVYLTLPDSLGDTRIDAADAAAGNGFLIQAVGLMAGKAVFTDGHVNVRKQPLSANVLRFDLDVRCEDQTRIRGSARVELAPHEVARFERRHAPDIALLCAPADRPAAEPAAFESPTTQRPGVGENSASTAGELDESAGDQQAGTEDSGLTTSD